jgi:2-hydroxychromene-2-carboxylate isomerase
MTRYEATQYQRELETMIRKERMTGAMMERAGLDPAESKARVRALQSRYRAVSNEAELVTRGELTRVRIPS